MQTAVELVGIPEVARELGVDQSTINRRIAAKRITPAAWVGRRALFTLDDVERLKRGEQQFPAGVERASGRVRDE